MNDETPNAAIRCGQAFNEMADRLERLLDRTPPPPPTPAMDTGSEPLAQVIPLRRAA